MLQGHKRAPSDVSVASSEDEKIPLSPTILESVPEKVEPITPLPAPNELPVANHVVSTSFVEEPASPAAEEQKDGTVDTPEEEADVQEKPAEEKLPGAEVDIASPEAETEPETPVKEMEQLEVTVEDEKEVDTAEVIEDTTESSEAIETPQEEMMESVEEPMSPTEEEEERYKHLKVTVTLPDKVSSNEENGEKATTEKEPEKAKDENERDSDSGSGSTADSSSMDLNLSISSFLSKTKEPGSVSVQVT